MLALPADAEAFIPRNGSFKDLHGPGCYALRLSRPDDLPAAWDAQYDERPTWFDRLVGAAGVVYIGEAGDVLRRLEEHRDGEVRTTMLTTVCEIDGLRNVWWADSKTDAEEMESRLTIMMQNQHPELFVWSN